MSRRDQPGEERRSRSCRRGGVGDREDRRKRGRAEGRSEERETRDQETGEIEHIERGKREVSRNWEQEQEFRAREARACGLGFLQGAGQILNCS